jgi:hypothetical protein
MKQDPKAEAEDEDRRNLVRTRVLRNAKIIVPRRSPVIHCTVQNITGGGACLKLANTYGIPETFDLTFEHGRTRRACRVVWRTGDQLGVAFADEDKAAAEDNVAGEEKVAEEEKVARRLGFFRSFPAAASIRTRFLKGGSRLSPGRTDRVSAKTRPPRR